jgi:chitin synthase
MVPSNVVRLVARFSCLKLLSINSKTSVLRMVRSKREIGFARGIGDPYALYASPNIDGEASSPWGAGYGDAFNASNQALPLVSNTSPFQRADLYEDDYLDRKSLRSDDFDAHSRFTSQREESMSNFGSESYAPSRIMFQNRTRKA